MGFFGDAWRGVKKVGHDAVNGITVGGYDALTTGEKWKPGEALGDLANGISLGAYDKAGGDTFGGGDPLKGVAGLAPDIGGLISGAADWFAPEHINQDDATTQIGGSAEQSQALAQRGMDIGSGFRAGGDATMGYAQQRGQDIIPQWQMDPGARRMQSDSFNAMMAAAQRPQGPSAAEAQMRQGSEDAMRQQLAIMRSSRGGASSQAQLAARDAGLDVMQRTNRDLGALRANEDAAFRQQQIGALGQAGGIAQNLRGTDISEATSRGNLMLGGREQNNQMELGLRNIALGQYGQAVPYEQMGQDYFKTQADLDEARKRRGLEGSIAQADVNQRTKAANIGLVGTGITALADFAGQSARAAGDAVPL